MPSDLLKSVLFIVVYCACCLANHSLENSIVDKDLVPHFYVNVADIESLESELSYIACKKVLFI